MAGKIESVSLFTRPEDGRATGDFPNQYSKSCQECKFRSEECQEGFGARAGDPGTAWGCKVSDIILKTLRRFPKNIEKVKGPYIYKGNGAVYAVLKDNGDFLAPLIDKLKLSSR